MTAAPLRSNPVEYTVAELSRALKRSIEENFADVRVRGEISGFKRHSSGHCYLAPTTVYELAKADLTPILEARPQVAQELCRALARRQAAGQLSASPELDDSVPKHHLTDWFSDRLHRLYNVVSVE